MNGALIQAFLVSGVVVSMSINFASPQDSVAEAALASAISDYERILKLADPITAGLDGDRDALRRLPDPRRETELARSRELGEIGGRLAQIDSGDLSGASRLNHQFLSRLISEAVEQTAFDFDRIAFQNDDGFHTLGDYLGRTTSIRSRDDADAWLARLEALPDYYARSIANLRRGIDTQFTQPKIVVDRVLDVARKQAGVTAENNPLLLPFGRMPPTIPAAVQAEYRNQALAMLRDRVGPAQRTFAAFLAQDYAPAARPAISWRTTPDGESSYRFLVHRETTTSLTPDEIHRLGLAEVARIRSLMDGTIKESGYSGTFAGFLELLRTDARFYAQTPEALLEKASEIAKRADDRLPALFGTLPRLSYGVRPVPSDIAEGYTTGRYWPGSLVAAQAGGYMVNTSDLRQRPLYELPALTVHEAVPGHHLQVALAQELEGMPYFRRHATTTAFVEGWGLYAEFLGEEMGIYRTPYERFGRYSYEMWRACRLVADTGIHWLGWDIDRARQCFAENSALSPHNIQTELERYISWPGQALAYKIGELRFRALRKEAESTLGEKFDIRTFHDVILLNGALPLDVLEARVREWINTGTPP